MQGKYNEIGKSYNRTRQADPRILQRIIEELGLESGASILDLGAGTGNYSYELAKLDYLVTALEPAEVMISQGKVHDRLKWCQGIAEEIPFSDETFDGVVCILAAHHFTDLGQSFAEIKRVLKDQGVAVIFTADPRLRPKDFWYDDYFAAIIEKSYRIHPPVSELTEMLAKVFNNKVARTAFPIPHDLQDGFFFSAWRYPERYLEMAFCEGISSLAETPTDILIEIQARLRNDLNNGHWQSKYGSILNEKNYDCGYFFLKVKKYFAACGPET